MIVLVKDELGNTEIHEVISLGYNSEVMCLVNQSVPGMYFCLADGSVYAIPNLSSETVRYYCTRLYEEGKIDLRSEGKAFYIPE